MKEFGALVRDTREARNLRGYDVAFALKQSPSWLSKLEAGTMTHPPSPTVMTAISDLLDIPVAALLDAIGYDVGGAADYDEMASAISRATAGWSARQKQMLWQFVRTVNAAGDDDHAHAS